MSAPLVINLVDGSVWERRAVSRAGAALYALAGSCACPEYVMASEAELAELGIAGSADVLPVPVGPEPQAQDSGERAKVAELIGDAKPATARLLEQLAQSVRDRREHEHPKWEDLYCLNLVSWMGERMAPVLRRLLDAEARVAELEAAPTTVYRAQHDSIVMGLYSTRQAAYEHCEAHELRDDPVSPMAWNVDEDGVAELVRLRIPRSPGAESATGYVVTPLEIASEYDEEADE